MNRFKTALRDLLLSVGYDIRKTSHVGLEANSDIQRIFGKQPLRTILDVGAHLGESATAYAKDFPLAMIYCFEPSPETFAALKENVSSFDRIKVFMEAVGERSETQTLFVNKFSATNSLLPTMSDVVPPTTRALMETIGCVDAKVTTLDEFCVENEIDTIDLLKLDVQGFESKVISGARKLLEQERVALIYTEVTFETHYVDQTKFAQLYSALTECGFELVDMYGQTRTTHHSVRWCDMLFLHPPALEKALNVE